MNLKKTYNLIAEDWFKDHHEDTWWIGGTDKFVSLLPTGASVLDVGCGAGVKSQYLFNKGLNVTGVDFSEKMIEIAKREVLSVQFQVMDIKNMIGLEETFDGVLAQAVLLHIPKAEVAAVIDELKSRLKEGGYLYLAQSKKGAQRDQKKKCLRKMIMVIVTNAFLVTLRYQKSKSILLM